jgi:hypothetical protein
MFRLTRARRRKGKGDMRRGGAARKKKDGIT